MLKGGFAKALGNYSASGLDKSLDKLRTWKIDFRYEDSQPKYPRGEREGSDDRHAVLSIGAWRMIANRRAF